MAYAWLEDLFWLLLVGYGVLTAWHALLYKRDPRAALGRMITARRFAAAVLWHTGLRV